MTLRSDISNSQILGLNFLGVLVMLLWQQVNMKAITSLQKISSIYLCCCHLLFAPCVHNNLLGFIGSLLDISTPYLGIVSQFSLKYLQGVKRNKSSLGHNTEPILKKKNLDAKRQKVKLLVQETSLDNFLRKG